MDACVGRADEKSYSVISRGRKWTSEWVNEYRGRRLTRIIQETQERKGRRCSCRCAWKRCSSSNKVFFFFFTVTRPTLNKIFVCLSLAVGNKKKMSMSIHTPVCLEALFIIAKPKLKTYPVNSPCPHLTQQFSQTSKEDIFRADSKAKTQFKCLKKNKKKKNKNSWFSDFGVRCSEDLQTWSLLAVAWANWVSALN